MKHLRTLAICTCVLAVCAFAFASPTVLGPTGLLVTPNADTAGMARIELGGYHVTDTVTTGSLNVGVAPMLEITGTWVDPDGGSSEGIASAKWRFREGTLTKPTIAVGIIDITDEFDVTPYVVVQKGFTVSGNGLTASGGYAAGDGLVDGFFAGAELMVGSKYKVMAEYDGDDFNAGVRFPWRDRVDVTAGIVNDELAIGARFRIR